MRGNVISEIMDTHVEMKQRTFPPQKKKERKDFKLTNQSRIFEGQRNIFYNTVLLPKSVKIMSKAAVRRSYSNLVFLNISQYSQENTYVGVSF